MNGTAFLLGIVVAIVYYYYQVHKERSAFRKNTVEGLETASTDDLSELPGRNEA